MNHDWEHLGYSLLMEPEISQYRCRRCKLENYTAWPLPEGPCEPASASIPSGKGSWLIVTLPENEGMPAPWVLIAHSGGVKTWQKAAPSTHHPTVTFC
jgi:hypothetical protein